MVKLAVEPTMGCAASSGAGETTLSSPHGASDEDGALTYNEALVFIKPHAATKEAKEFVVEFLQNRGIEVLKEGKWLGPEIDKKGIIDEHYAHIAKIALKVDPADIVVTDEKKELFESTFGETWTQALDDGKLINLKTFEDEFTELTFSEINRLWLGDLEKIKLAPGTYVGYFPDQDRYVMNPFYANMRAVYTNADAKVTYFVIRFEENNIPWKVFRSDIIGATDPAQAHEGSLRASMLAKYKALGLKSEPNTSDNGVHASAGPFEGLKERIVWTGAKIETDLLGKELIAQGVSRALINSWLDNEVVTINGETDHAFDLLEDLDSSKALELALHASS